MTARPFTLLALLALGACAQPSGPAPARRAAIAIRDEVPGYQQWGSQAFTAPLLRSGYARSWYLTEESGAPQRQAFLDALAEAARTCDSVDLFLLTNGNSYYLDWAGEAEPAARARLRLVYNTGAGGASLGPSWTALGARAYVGHPGANAAPVFYAYFLPAWLSGAKLADAVELANRQTHSHLESSLTSQVLGAVRFASGSAPSAEAVWIGTRAQISGDPELEP